MYVIEIIIIIIIVFVATFLIIIAILLLFKKIFLRLKPLQAHLSPSRLFLS